MKEKINKKVLKDRLFRNKGVLGRSRDSGGAGGSQSPNQSGRLESLKMDPPEFQHLTDSYQDPADRQDLAISNPFHETFNQVWRRYLKLLESNSRYLFEDTDKSKDRFCELLHSQIDVSNKLFMILSQTDDRKFMEYSQQMNSSFRMRQQGFSVDMGASDAQIGGQMMHCLALPSIGRQGSAGVRSQVSLSKEGPGRGNEMVAFLKAQEGGAQNQSPAQSNYLNVKHYLFDETQMDAKFDQNWSLLNTSVVAPERGWEVLDPLASGTAGGVRAQSGVRTRGGLPRAPSGSQGSPSSPTRGPLVGEERDRRREQQVRDSPWNKAIESSGAVALPQARVPKTSRNDF